MVIISRKDAAAAGLGQYFTGKPCKYDHISPRYTQSGTCSQCVLDAAAATRAATANAEFKPRTRFTQEREDKLRASVAARQAKVEALRALVPIRVPINMPDVTTVFETSVALCLEAYPILERLDVLPARTPVRGTPLYVINSPPESVQLLRDIANELYSKNRPDFSHLQHRIIRSVEKAADDEASAPPEGWR